MKITAKWLEKKKACEDAISEFEKQAFKSINGVDLVKLLIKKSKLDWANWLIVRLMTYKQRIMCAVYAAEQVIDIFEKKYPMNNKPRKAIEAARKCITNPSKKNKAYAVTAAAADAYATAYAAAAVGHADAAYAVAYAAAAAHAYDAVDAAWKKKRIKILKYGLRILRKPCARKTFVREK